MSPASPRIRPVLLLLVLWVAGVLAGCGGGGGGTDPNGLPQATVPVPPGVQPSPPPPPPPAQTLDIAPQSLPEAQVAQQYSAQIAATGGTPPLLFTVVGGSVPAGLTMNAAGLVSGGAGFTGDYAFTVQVRDSRGNSDAAEVTLSVTGESHLLLTEVLYDGPGNDNVEEWIEIYNPSSRPVDLSGFTVTDSVGTVTVDTIPRGYRIPANGFFTWARDGAGFRALYGVDPDLTGLNLTLNNTGDSVSLKDRAGAEVDFVAFEIAPFSGLSGTNTSIQRMSLGDTDTQADWAATASGVGAPFAFAGQPSPDRAPVARAGPDQAAAQGDGVTLDASASTDPDGDPMAFEWSNGLEGATPGMTAGAPGALDLTVTVGDGTLFDLDFMTLFTVGAGDPILGRMRVNRPPVSHGLDQDLVQVIAGATTTLDVAVFELNRQAIVDALVAAKGRGVTVRVATENTNFVSAGDAPFYAQLTNAGIPVFPDNTAGLMHDKFCVVDGQRVWTGSYNFTETDTAANANDAFLIESSTLAAAFASEFAEFAAGRFANNKTNAPTTQHTVQGRTVECHFSPKGSPAAQILDVINSADSEIVFSQFVFTRADLRDAILARAAAGVPVRGLIDAGQAGIPSSVFPALDAAPNVEMKVDSYRGLLHHKFLVVDAGTDSDPTVVTGSFNWTDAAQTSNDENILILHDRGVATQYRHRFGFLFDFEQ